MNTRSLLTQKLFLPPVSLPLLHKRGVSEHKLCSCFLFRVFILPKVGPVVAMEYIRAAPTPPRAGSCMDAASKNLYFHRFFSPCTPRLFFWLSLTQLQLFQLNLFLHKGPGVDTLISRGCFQRCLVAFSPGSI